MSRDYWMLVDDLCRCCHSEGTFQNLAGAFNFGEEGENMYCNLIRDTLDISIAPVAGALCAATFTICDACIARLRDAASFKRQVLRCEHKFNDLYGRNFIKLAESDYKVEVKEEEPEIDTEDAAELAPADDCLDDSFEIQHDDDDEQSNTKPIKQESKKKSKKTPQKAKPKSKPKKPPKKCGRPRKIKEIKEEAPADDKDNEHSSLRPVTSKLEQLLTRGGKVPKFRLLDDDYTKDGDSYGCARCDKRYDKLFSLKFHVKTKHYKIPRFVCPYCRKEFMTPAPLTVHKLQEHDVDDRFKCNACKGMFNTKVQLRKHINNFHMLGEKYKCDFCEYESFSFEGMYKHKFKHKTVKDYHCRFCRKSFLRKTTLDLHERIHTGDRRKVCAVCGQAFVQKASLNYHMNKYHPEVNF